MTTITIPRETFDQMRNALELVYSKLSGNVNGADEHCFTISMKNQISYIQMCGISEALSAAKAVSEDKRQSVTITSVKMVGGVAPEAELMRQATEQLEGMGFRVEHPKAVQPQAQGEAIVGRSCKVGGPCVPGKASECACLELPAPEHPQASEPAWIAVSDRLPEPEVTVLCYGPNRIDPTLPFLVFTDWCGSKPDFGRGVTHWMPLPAAPEAKK